MEQMNIRIERGLVKEVDRLVKENKTYHNRSDFIRHAVRQQLIEEKKRFLDEYAKQIAKELRKMGINEENAKLLTRKEKDKIAEEFARLKGFK
jgi:Arc/MetJ-type ribon-helix-helix transcriptional regulator